MYKMGDDKFVMSWSLVQRCALACDASVVLFADAVSCIYGSLGMYKMYD